MDDFDIWDAAQPKSHLLPGGGSHDRLPSDERIKDEFWLVFLRHHPDLLLLARQLRGGI
jgi:hypothetical protein